MQVLEVKEENIIPEARRCTVGGKGSPITHTYSPRCNRKAYKWHEAFVLGRLLGCIMFSECILRSVQFRGDFENATYQTYPQNGEQSEDGYRDFTASDTPRPKRNFGHWLAKLKAIGRTRS